MEDKEMYPRFHDQHGEEVESVIHVLLPHRAAFRHESQESRIFIVAMFDQPKQFVPTMLI